jgi:hypothetical protein
LSEEKGTREVKFNGTAAIPILSGVTMLVDNPSKPTAAYQIVANGITYTREEPPKERIVKLLPTRKLPNFIEAKVEKVTIYTGQKGESVTYLTIFDIHPKYLPPYDKLEPE